MQTGTVTSKDGTIIAFDRVGRGPVVILVDGAMGSRDGWGLRPLAERLAGHFTVYTYDRRGRGESGNTLPFALEREIEDIEALIDDAGGGAAHLYGISSGAALALEAALALGDRVAKLALYEAPYNSDETARRNWKEYRRALAELLAEDRRGDAVALFMKLVGADDEGVEGMRQSPMWPLMEAIGHTLAYDAEALGQDGSVPVARAARLAVPTLVMNGDASYPFMHETAVALAAAIPNAQHRVLAGQTHEVEVEALAPLLITFFGDVRPVNRSHSA
ncbi:MAG TPA: alpha/beta hydrolase [Anaerolineae bacterium]|nr:alpha/beta hydrolase [Anaerolineae bacterium]